MKLHRTLVNAVTETLGKIFRDGQYADKAVEQVLKSNARFGSRDRKFIAENVYGMVRWWRLISEAAGSDDLIRLFAVWMIMKGEELPDWEEFRQIDRQNIVDRVGELRTRRSIAESVPDWLDEMAVAQLGEASWAKELHAMNEEARVVLRVNRLRTTPEKLAGLLSEKEIATESLSMYPDALVLLKRQSLHALDEYKNGLFEIQDASSQLIAPALELQPGLTVIDACAGAGGKSLHIAAMMRNKGTVISMDVEERKLQELSRRAERGGVTCIRTRLISESNINALKNSADRLLLDVPCSGLGVLRRNPDAKWKLSPEFIAGVRRTQQEIITRYSQMLKSGGVMVYATCSILPSENQDQVSEFLKKEKDFELISDRKVMPSEGFDGFYLAKLQKHLNTKT